MNELDHALRKLRLSGMADTLELRLLEAPTERQAPIDTVSVLVSDELLRRQDRLLDRRLAQARFRDAGKTLKDPTSRRSWINSSSQKAGC